MDNQKTRFKFSKPTSKTDSKTLQQETNDNFNVTELVKYYNDFISKYNKIDEDLKEFINSLPENMDSSTSKNDFSTKIEELNNSLKNLKEDFKVNAQFLVSHDKHNYLEMLEKLTKSINDTKERLNPRKKFAFSSKTSAQTTQTTREPKNVSEVESKDNTSISKNNTNDSDLVIKNKSNEKVILSESENFGKNNLIIENLENCEVQILLNFKACYVKNVNNSRIYLGSINGGAHINDCQNCKFYLTTHQLRIHKTSNSLFSIIVSSNPIIEDCYNLLFSPLNITYSKLDENLKSAGLSKDKNKWNSVLDFKWHKKEKSPNFEYVEEDSVDTAPIQLD